MRVTISARSSLVVATVTAILAGCVQWTADNGAEPSLPTAPSARAGKSAAPTPDVRARVERLKGRVAWVADLHRNAMDDLVANKSAYLRTGPGSTSARQCRAVHSLVTKYSPAIESRIGQLLTPAEREAKVREVLGIVPKCRELASRP